MDDTKTMTAEELSQQVQRLRSILIEHGLVKEIPGAAQSLVTVLAAQAVRELEATLERVVKEVADAAELEAEAEEARSEDEESPEAARERGIVEGAREVLKRYRAALASQPPPAPAQSETLRPESWCRGCPHPPHLGPCTRRSGGTAYQCPCLHATLPSPTPPPGLREASAPLAEHLRAELALMVDFPDTDPLWHRHDITVGHARAFVAAFDATGGGKVLCPGCKQMAPAEQMHTRCTLCAAHDATGGEDWAEKMQDDLRVVQRLAAYGSPGETQTPLGGSAYHAVQALRGDATGGEHGPDATCPNCKADHEDAAKYRAAVELAKDGPLVMRHAILAYLDSTPTGVEAVPNVVRAVCNVLGLTLDTPPSGPGGGCKAHPGQQCDPETPGVYECRAVPASGRLLDARPIATRACIAPTPTPEVPPLQPVPGLAMPPTAVQSAIQSQYSATAVVWEGDGVRVLADGTPEMLVNATWDVAHGLCVEAIARALAEAKREVDRLTRQIHTLADKAGAEWNPREQDEKPVPASVRLLRLASEASAARGALRKAAESMRERAKQTILKQQATEEDGPTSDDNGYAFNMLLRLADEIGKLPLE